MGVVFNGDMSMGKGSTVMTIENINCGVQLLQLSRKNLLRSYKSLEEAGEKYVKKCDGSGNREMNNALKVLSYNIEYIGKVFESSENELLSDAAVFETINEDATNSATKK